MVNTVMTKLKIIFIAVFLVTVLAFPCQALSTGTAYMYDANGNSYASPEAYVPSNFISGISLKTGAFSTPQDIYVDSNRNIYISDTGNNRIIVVDKNLHVTRSVNEVLIQGEKSALSNPNGIFFGNDGLLYICDTGNSRVIALDSNNNVRRNITGDDIIAVNENLQFRPEKVVADNEGIVYIVSSDIYQGILQYDTEDKFVGFFSPNEVTVSIGVRLKAMWKRIFSEEQYNYTEKILPVAYNREIRKKVATPLVLHGGSGLSDDDFRNTVKEGIAKVNIFTDLCVAGENAMQYSVKNNLSYLEARSKKVEYIKKAIMDKISLFGSREKA